ncbi:EmrB/QacA subfamily drug resistance transporter [Nocardia bhagyanarayanae]|uniref:EmrB/QacA subfamily drug resistance transporter n=2 Tax=Nocardia bhagyanarayanae TaxID=1215925 RepID=A0A543FG84_9NOCA|nr:EmrB/QacA subfamily drug resistance transporter [Nocardia bhagyanarayanae]
MDGVAAEDTVATDISTTRRPVRDHSTAIVWILCSAAFIAMLDVFVVNVAFTNIAESYRGSSLADVSWVLNGYAIVYAALLIPAGRVSDRFGRKAGFLVGLGIFTLASLACAVAPSLWTLVAFRVLQAVGAAALTPASLGLLLTVLPPTRVPGAVKVWATTSSAAAAFGPVVGGALVEASWRWVFLINLPVSLVAGVAAMRLVPNHHRRTPSRMPDLLGVALLIVAIGALSLGLVQSGEWRWSSAATLGTLAVAAVGVAGFVARMTRHRNPVVSPDLFRVPTFVWANVTVFAFCTAFGAWFLSMAMWLENAAGFDTMGTGLAIVPGPLMVPIFAAVSQRLISRIPVGIVVALGNLLFASGVALVLATASTPVRYAADVLPGWLISGVGIGLALPSMIASAAVDLPPDQSATGSAVVNTARQLGYVLGVAVLIAILGSLDAPADRMLTAFQHGWLFIAIVAIASAATAFGLTPRTRQS